MGPAAQRLPGKPFGATEEAGWPLPAVGIASIAGALLNPAIRWEPAHIASIREAVSRRAASPWRGPTHRPHSTGSRRPGRGGHQQTKAAPRSGLGFELPPSQPPQVVAADPATADLHVTIRDASGRTLWRPSVDGFNALALKLAPSGDAITDQRNAATASGFVTLPDGFVAQGWLDSHTVVGRQSDGELASVSLDSPKVVHSLGVMGTFVGSLPGR
jgi:hypothetical protein